MVIKIYNYIIYYYIHIKHDAIKNEVLLYKEIGDGDYYHSNQRRRTDDQALQSPGRPWPPL